MATVTKEGEYTEAHHMVYGTVKEAAPIAIGIGKRFRPSRVTIKYDWRTQLGHDDWGGVRFEMSGPYIGEDDEPTGTGSGTVIFPPDGVPTWAQEFAKANVPTVGLRSLDDGMRGLLERALPMLIRLGDFIGNGEVDPNRPGSRGARCDLIGDIRKAVGHV